FGNSTGDASSAAGLWSPSSLGWYAPPQKFTQLKDGLSNIVLFGEGYAVCNGTNRKAVYPPNSHNFGISPGVSSVTITSSTGEFNGINGQTITATNGLPNTLMFQIKPVPVVAASCPAGTTC